MNNNETHRCKSKTKLGRACRAAATEGGLCYFHANPTKASELGRIGGRSKRLATAAVLDIESLNTAGAVRDTTARLISDVYSGKVRSNLASALATLLNLQLRAIQTSDQEARIAALEQKLAEAGNKSDRCTDGEPICEPHS